MTDSDSQDFDFKAAGRRSPVKNRTVIQPSTKTRRSQTRSTHFDDRAISQNGVLRDRTSSIFQRKPIKTSTTVTSSSTNLDINRGVYDRMGETNDQPTKARSSKAKSKPSRTKPPPKTDKKPQIGTGKKVELNFLAAFKGRKGARSEWVKASLEQKYLASQKTDNWFPDGNDFEEMANLGRRPNSKNMTVHTSLDVMIQLALIGSKSPGTVDRVNIFAHGADNMGEISMDGTVSHKGVDWPEKYFPGATFNHALFDITSDPDRLIKPHGGKEISVTNIKNAFAPRAHVYVYACHAGLTDEYLKQLSIAFGVPVKGFSTEILYGLHKDNTGKIIRDFGSSRDHMHRDFHDIEGAR